MYFAKSIFFLAISLILGAISSLVLNNLNNETFPIHNTFERRFLNHIRCLPKDPLILKLNNSKTKIDKKVKLIVSLF